MQDVIAADRAAFSGPGGIDIANHIIAESGLRVGFERRRGRGAGVNPTGRFEPFARSAYDDGWNSLEELPAFKTDVQVEKIGRAHV